MARPGPLPILFLFFLEPSWGFKSSSFIIYCHILHAFLRQGASPSSPCPCISGVFFTIRSSLSLLNPRLLIVSLLVLGARRCSFSSILSSGVPPYASSIFAFPPLFHGHLRLSSAWRALEGGLDHVVRVSRPVAFREMFLIPAISTTARTAPPAITPVPSKAGLMKTWLEPYMPVISCGTVPLDKRDLHDALLCPLDRLSDRVRHLVRLSQTEADVCRCRHRPRRSR